MRIHFAIAVVLIGVAGDVRSQSQPSIELALAGEFLGDRPSPASGAGWFAVVHTSSGVTMTRTNISVERVPNSCSEVATRITVPGEQVPLFVFRGLPSLREGPVDTAFDGYKPIGPSESITLKIGSGVRFGLFSKGRQVPVGGGSSEVQTFDYELQMGQDRQVQTIAKFPIVGEDGRPTLIWAGDLDRDGKPDALIDLRPYVGGRYALFLSSLAGAGELVRNVAEFSFPGC